MSKFGKDLIESMTDAVAFAQGRDVAATVHVVDVPDVRAIRFGLHMSQQRFAETYRIPLPTLKNWEQGAGRRMRRLLPICRRSRACRRRSRTHCRARRIGGRGAIRCLTRHRDDYRFDLSFFACRRIRRLFVLKIIGSMVSDDRQHCKQIWKSRVDRLPDHFEVDIEVTMRDAVSHPFHVSPRNLGV